MTSLVVCAGHAVYVGVNFLNPEEDVNWYLQKFQEGEPPFYIGHMKAAVEKAAEDPESILVFSGGETRLEAGPLSEAMSYWRLSSHFGWWGHDSVKARALCEEYARDSFENLLFSLARFREFMGTYPEKLVVVSWAFKAERFSLHVEACRFPSDQYQFVGANNPDDMTSALRGEAKTIEGFRKDPYGTQDPFLKKRQERNPFRRGIPYLLTAPEMKGLITHQGPELYNSELPW